ncbi:MAG: hypothetical protein H2174_09715 [Vampirovibrio sp.]|nr:hypothetical protein [Vampirovibrio sp.]
MMGLFQTVGSSIARGATKVAKAGAKEVIGTLDDTMRLARGARNIDPAAVAERFEGIDGAWNVFDHATHLNTASILDIVEDGVTPSTLSFLPHVAHQIGIMKTVGGVPEYVNLLKATTPNPLPALREGFDSVQSIFARNATSSRFA